MPEEPMGGVETDVTGTLGLAYVTSWARDTPNLGSRWKVKYISSFGIWLLRQADLHYHRTRYYNFILLQYFLIL
jgi:hypothetical protein